MADEIKLLHWKERMPLMFIRFYAVGLILFFIPFTRPLFVSITSLSLLLVIGAVMAFHRDWNTRTVLWFVFIVVSSFLLEMAGVNGGRIFGAYAYGRGLAPLVNGTPLIIGLNWLFLVYASHNIAQRFNLKPWARVLTGSLLMILYDLVVEWVAPYMNMWDFGQAYPPFRNFVVWFIAAVVYQTGFELFRIRSDNPPARFLFALQLVFFLFVGIYSAIFIR